MRVKGLNEVESRSLIPMNFPKESLDSGWGEEKPNNSVRKEGSRWTRRQSIEERGN